MDRLFGVGDKLQLEPSFLFDDRRHTNQTIAAQINSPKTSTLTQIVMIGAKIYLRINGDLSRELHFHFGSNHLYRTEETCRPTNGKQLLWIGAATGSARDGKLHVQ